jgi:hypothetical protein
MMFTLSVAASNPSSGSSGGGGFLGALLWCLNITKKDHTTNCESMPSFK